MKSIKLNDLVIHLFLRFSIIIFFNENQTVKFFSSGDIHSC